jgi:D-hexose-6-phosphate mutarotase
MWYVALGCQSFAQVVWNCYEEGAKKMTDMEDKEWSAYVCCEVAAIGKPIEVAPGSCWEGGQTLMRGAGESKY